jgi:6-phosphofructokinase 1
VATGAEAVLVPETTTDLDNLVAHLEKHHRRGKTSGIVVVAEGDDAGNAFQIAGEVKKRLNYPWEIKVSILGHIQRGGSPTCMDRVLASRLGLEAVRALRDGRYGVAIGQLGRKIEYTPFTDAIKHNRRPNPVLEELVVLLS